MKSRNLDIKEMAKKPEWSEVIKLYSGLFDIENERTEFIIDLSNKEVHIASQCLTSSITQIKDLESLIKEKAFKGFESQPTQSILALLELNDADKLFLSAKSTFKNPFGKRDKKYFEELMISLTHQEMTIYLDYVTKLKKLTFLIWLVPYLRNYKWNEHQKSNLQIAFNRLFRNKYFNQSLEIYKILNEDIDVFSSFVLILLEEKRKDALKLSFKLIEKHKLIQFNSQAILEALNMTNKQLKRIETIKFIKK